MPLCHWQYFFSFFLQVEELVDSPHQLLAVKPTVVDCKELKISRVRISFAKFVLEERETKSEEEEETSESDQDQDSESELFEVLASFTCPVFFRNSPQI